MNCAVRFSQLLTLTRKNSPDGILASRIPADDRIQYPAHDHGEKEHVRVPGQANCPWVFWTKLDLARHGDFACVKRGAFLDG
jgi:hypothetical protein